MNNIVIPLIGLIHGSIYPPESYHIEYHDLLNNYIQKTLEKLQFSYDGKNIGIPFEEFKEQFEIELNKYLKVANESNNCPIRYFLEDIYHITYSDCKFYNLPDNAMIQNDMAKQSLKQVHEELKSEGISKADIFYLSILVLVKGEPIAIVYPKQNYN